MSQNLMRTSSNTLNTSSTNQRRHLFWRRWENNRRTGQSVENNNHRGTSNSNNENIETLNPRSIANTEFNNNSEINNPIRQNQTASRINERSSNNLRNIKPNNLFNQNVLLSVYKN